MMSRISLLIALLLVCLTASAQESTTEWFLNANVNAYIPGGKSAKSVFPVLGYNRNTSPKLLLGGVGAGAFLWRPVSEDLHLKVYGTISKLSYWDDPVIITNGVGAYSGTLQNWSSDYVLGIGGIIHYNLANRLLVGAGLGTQTFLISLSRMPEMYGYGNPAEPSIAINRYYKRILPVVPFEIAYKMEKMLINLRYDLGLLNCLKGELGKNKSEKFGVITLEVGFKLK